jgi:hypothetical protein
MSASSFPVSDFDTWMNDIRRISTSASLVTYGSLLKRDSPLSLKTNGNSIGAAGVVESYASTMASAMTAR